MSAVKDIKNTTVLFKALMSTIYMCLKKPHLASKAMEEDGFSIDDIKNSAHDMLEQIFEKNDDLDENIEIILMGIENAFRDFLIDFIS